MRLLTVAHSCVLLTMGNFKAKAQQSLIAPGALGYFNDAYLMSNHQVYGTARFQGLGGARTALGGDVGSIAANPAGLGFFNKSEFSVSGSLGFLRANSSFLNNESRSSASNFNLPNIGVVLNYTKDDIVPSKWRGINVGFGINRIANFHQQFEYSGVNSTNSIIDFYLESAAQYDPQVLIDEVNNNEILSADVLGFATYLVDFGSWRGGVSGLDPSDTFGRYDSWIPITPMNQSEKVRRRGSITQFDVALGGNYDDKLYIGASLGIQSIRFSEVRTYSETVVQPAGDPNFSPLVSLNTRDELNINGVGINLTGGIIYRPIDMVRFGLSFRTPTLMGLNQNFINSLDVVYDGRPYLLDPNLTMTNFSYSTLRGEFRYNVTTPSRINAGVAVFAGKKGFVSADVEMVSYNDARVRSRDANLSADDRTIATLFEPIFIYRVGAEFREDIYRFRGGFGYQPSGIISNDNINRDLLTFSLGAGYRKDHYYIDLSVVNQRFSGGYSPYTLINGTHPGVENRFRNTFVTVTYGTFF